MSDRRTAAAVERWARAHRSELAADLTALISIRSVADYGEGDYPMGSGCKKALDFFGDLARSYGFSTETNDDHTLSVLMPGKTEQHELGILGHLDVVDAGEGWKYDPFSAIEKNGYLIGRGAVDNKGPVLMALYTLRCMQEIGLSLKSSVRLIAGCDEEREMRDIQHFLHTHEPPAFTLNCDGAWAAGIGEKGILTADLVLPLENSQLADAGGGASVNTVPALAWASLRDVDPSQLSCPEGVTAESRDGLLFLQVKGKAAHCATPQNGQNAIRLLLKLLCSCSLLADEDVRRLNRLLKAVSDDFGTGLRISYADALSGSTTCTPVLLSLQNGALRLRLNIRFSIAQSPEILIRQLHRGCEKLGLGAEILSVTPPRCNSTAQPEIRLLVDTCREFLGKHHHPYAAGGGTYSRLFPSSLPFGPVTLGRPAPNALGGPHAADEAVCIEDLIQAMKVYAIALIRLDRYFSQPSPDRSNTEPSAVT